MFLFKQFTCESVPLSGRRQERTLTKFNPGCSRLEPEIQSTQFCENQMPLSKELMHVVAGISGSNVVLNVTTNKMQDVNDYSGLDD